MESSGTRLGKGDDSDLRRIDPRTGEVLESIEMSREVGISGLESDGRDQFFCGGGEERQGSGGSAASERRRKGRLLKPGHLSRCF